MHLNDILSKNEPNAMETSTVCTNLTETPTDTTRELSNDQKSLAQFGISIEVGKAVISTQVLKVYKKNLVFVFKKK